MIVVSPAKKLNLDSEDFNFEFSQPYFIPKTKKIVKKIRSLTVDELKSLMNISDSLAVLNFQRFREFDFSRQNVKPAVFLFSGDTFNGLSIRKMNLESLEYAQKKLRILSGLYGILRPFDNIKPYRLEMGTNIESLLGEDLYKFWLNEITNKLNNDLKNEKSNYLFNLASREYFKSIDERKLLVRVINFDFKKIKNSKISNIGMMIKKCRGLMAKFLIEKEVNTLDKIQSFNEFGFKFDSFNKSNNTFLFVSR